MTITYGILCALPPCCVLQYQSIHAACLIVPAFIYIQEEFPVETLVLWDVSPCRFSVEPPTFRRRIFPLILGPGGRGRGLIDPEDKGTKVVWNVWITYQSSRQGHKVTFQKARLLANIGIRASNIGVLQDAESPTSNNLIHNSYISYSAFVCVQSLVISNF